MTTEKILTKTSILQSHLQETISIMANQSEELIFKEVLPIIFSPLGMLKFDRTKIVKRLEIIIADNCLKDDKFNTAVDAISRLTPKEDKEKMLNQHYPVHRLLFAKQCTEDIVDDPFQYMN